MDTNVSDMPFRSRFGDTFSDRHVPIKVRLGVPDSMMHKFAPPDAKPVPQTPEDALQAPLRTIWMGLSWNHFLPVADIQQNLREHGHAFTQKEITAALKTLQASHNRAERLRMNGTVCWARR